MNADASIQGTKVGYWTVDEYEDNAMTFTVHPNWHLYKIYLFKLYWDQTIALPRPDELISLVCPLQRTDPKYHESHLWADLMICEHNKLI